MFPFSIRLTSTNCILTSYLNILTLCQASSPLKLCLCLRLKAKMLTREVRDVRNTYCRCENSVRQRQSLQVCHKAVGQEAVDGRDLRGRGRLNWQKRHREIHWGLFRLVAILFLIGIRFRFFYSSWINRRLGTGTGPPHILRLWFFF